jgi:hypothetical protein
VPISAPKSPELTGLVLGWALFMSLLI